MTLCRPQILLTSISFDRNDASRYERPASNGQLFFRPPLRKMCHGFIPKRMIALIIEILLITKVSEWYDLLKNTGYR
jgi:hypothetical protein